MSVKQLFLLILIFCLLGIGTFSNGALAEKDIPSYAKWGNIAVKETIKKYPEASVVDYLHIGREDKCNRVAVEKFKLWLRSSEREFGVFVDVEFDK